MSEPRLPQEIIDYIVDLLRNERGTLSQCCLVSKSWIPRTRKHLFGEINFTSPTDPEEWMGMFPDPSNSPARYSHCLRIRCARDPIPEATKMGGWILSLTNVVRLVIIGTYLAPSLSPVLEIICSLPLLKDLHITSPKIVDSGHSVVFQPSTSPPLTGAFYIHMSRGVGHTMRALLDLPNGVHFQKITFTACLEEDFRWMAALVEACSGSLQYIDLRSTRSAFPQHSFGSSIDLSGAAKLKEVIFRSSAEHVEWVTTGLKTIGPEHRDIQRITVSIRFPSALNNKDFQEEVREQWVDLGRVLTRLWEYYSVRTKLLYCMGGDLHAGEKVCEFIENVLPESTKAGVIELAGARINVTTSG